MIRNTPAYIRWVQSSLNATLGSRLRVDGISGPRTRLATRSFQQRVGLPAIGIVGPKTEDALIAAGAPPPILAHA
jgi:peptidoglycan hydrolase-like protein with peptidoglycan-binding domain